MVVGLGAGRRRAGPDIGSRRGGLSSVTDPRRAAAESEQLLAEALRAKAGGNPGLGRAKASASTGGTGPSRPVAARQPLTLVQLILSSLIAGLVVGILLAVLTLI
jgi:hypothetical protein